jgi:ABC-type multidrug transport system fused ATPase/permease subunit
MILDSNKARRLWGYLKPYWKMELLTFLVMAVIAGLTLALPIAVQYLIDDLIPSLIAGASLSSGIMSVVYFGLVLAGIYFAQVLFGLMRDYLAAYIGGNIIADMRSQLFDHLQRLPLRFFQTHQVGEVMSRMLADINRIQYLLTSTLLMFLTNILVLVAILIYLLNTNWLLTLIAIIPVPLTIFFTGKLGKRLHDIVKRLQETIAEFSARLQESFLSVKTIKTFGQENAEKGRVDKILKGMTRLYVENSITNSLAGNFVYFINMIGPIVVLSWGTYLIVGGTMKLGALMAFYILLTYLYSPIQSLASVSIEVQSALAPVERIFEYLDLPPEIIEDKNPVTITQVRGEIVLDNVSFRYGADGFALQQFSLTIKAKENIAIVGPSGSGKTTIINIIMRFMDPDSGVITIDGIDLRKLSLKSLRSIIGFVDQDPLLFRTTIFDNIAYAAPGATLEDVVQASKIANAHDFISNLPNGYDTVVGERGVTLSGGEKQRICLARAILTNPPIIILDEATSALDSKSEYLIQEALKNILIDKTTIIIAHRLSTIQHAHRIIAIDDGRIVGQGSHEELMDKSPLYRDLAKRQLRL